SAPNIVFYLKLIQPQRRVFKNFTEYRQSCGREISEEVSYTVSSMHFCGAPKINLSLDVSGCFFYNKRDEFINLSNNVRLSST
ncbi:hypothetical protein, partial [uncultured Negativicoccus sp.]|uniref:hypothetical protein n=1 Tax=uncultured Negativicoccus sp. TaxID=1587526 RepID=UPI002586C243